MCGRGIPYANSRVRTTTALSLVAERVEPDEFRVLLAFDPSHDSRHPIGTAHQLFPVWRLILLGRRQDAASTTKLRLRRKIPTDAGTGRSGSDGGAARACLRPDCRETTDQFRDSSDQAGRHSAGNARQNSSNRKPADAAQGRASIHQNAGAHEPGSGVRAPSG